MKLVSLQRLTEIWVFLTFKCQKDWPDLYLVRAAIMAPKFKQQKIIPVSASFGLKTFHDLDFRLCLKVVSPLAYFWSNIDLCVSAAILFPEAGIILPSARMSPHQPIFEDCILQLLLFCCPCWSRGRARAFVVTLTALSKKTGEWGFIFLYKFQKLKNDYRLSKSVHIAVGYISKYVIFFSWKCDFWNSLMFNFPDFGQIVFEVLVLLGKNLHPDSGMV